MKSYNIDFSYVDVELKAFFTQIWRLFSEWTIPIIGLTPGDFLISLMVLGLISFIIKVLIGMTGGVSISVGGALKERRNSKKRERNN